MMTKRSATQPDMDEQVEMLHKLQPHEEHHHHHEEHGHDDHDIVDDVDENEDADPHARTCKVFCKEYGHQCAVMTKTATAICVALLWSTTVTTLLRSVFSSFLVDYTSISLWVGLLLISILVLCVIPRIAFRYADYKDYWAVLLIIEILGHLWGFKVKDLATDAAYRLHHFAWAFENITTSPRVTFCDIVNPSFAVETFASNVTAFDAGFVGYNLDWGEYTHERDVFEGYYPNGVEDVPSPAPTVANTTNNTRRALAGQSIPTMPTPSPFVGAKTRLHSDDEHIEKPGGVCAFEYKTVSSLDGYSVEKTPRLEYWIELGSRIVIWIAMISVTTVTVILFRLLYNKAIFPHCCKKRMTHNILHNYTHIQNHLIADAFANAMGWVSAWVVWWILLLVVMLLANLGGFGYSVCNGMDAFPLATAIIGFGVLYILIFALSWGRKVCWQRALAHCKSIDVYLGGVGELQNGFMLGWYLISLCKFIHATFVGIYFADGAAAYSPFDDVFYSHPYPSIALAVEEVFETIFWTLLGITYLTFAELDIKEAEREAALLVEAKRRLTAYFHLIHSFDTSSVAEDITYLVNLRQASTLRMKNRAVIIMRGFGVWLGLTIELTIHLIIEFVDVIVVDAYNEATGVDTGYNSAYGYTYAQYDYASSYSYSYGDSGYSYSYGSVDYASQASTHAVKFGVQFAFSAGLTGVFFGFMFIGHHCRWRISKEKKEQAAALRKVIRSQSKSTTKLESIDSKDEVRSSPKDVENPASDTKVNDVQPNSGAGSSTSSSTSPASATPTKRDELAGAAEAPSPKNPESAESAQAKGDSSPEGPKARSSPSPSGSHGHHHHRRHKKKSHHKVHAAKDADQPAQAEAEAKEAKAKAKAEAKTE